MKSIGNKFFGVLIILVLTLAMLIMPAFPAMAATLPVVSTVAATGIANDAATLNGNLTVMGSANPVNVSFEYGYTTAYGKTTAAQPLGAIGPYSAPVAGLFPGMLWHFRAVAVGDGTVYGDDMTFTTTSVDAPYFTAKFAFVSARDGNQEIYGITPDGRYSMRLTNNLVEEEWPRFAADFTKVTFTSWRDGNAEVYGMNPDGTVQTRITTNTAFDGMSDFSWNGARIAFVSDRDGNYEIYVMNADGTGQTRLTNNIAADIMPAFSPDGTKIAFTSNRDGNYEVYVINADGSNPVNLTNNTSSDNYPSWLNDGTKICFSSMRSGTSEIYTMDADGANQAALMNNASPPVAVTGDQPAWCPTGAAIFYTSWAINNIPQIMFIGVGPYLGMGPFPFTSNPEGNWSRADWTMPVTQTYTITASVLGGNGGVEPATQTITSGASATVTITPDAGYHIFGITDNGTAVTTASPYIITNVSADHAIVVAFSNTYLITASAGAGGTIAPTGEIAIVPGASQDFTITANDGFSITSVTVDGAPVTLVENSYTFTNVIADHTIAATFASTQTFTVSASVSEGNGTAEPATQTITAGTSATVTITPGDGYHIFGITDNGTAVTTASPYIITNVSADHAIVVAFSNTYLITATASTGGTITPAGEVAVAPGAGQAFTITPDSGYHIASLTVDGVVITPIVSSYNFPDVNANHTIETAFAINEEITNAIAMGTDDGFSSSGGGYYGTLEWFEAGSLEDGPMNDAWFRFTNITIPVGAVIDEAYLEIIQSDWETGTSLRIYAENAADPSAPIDSSDQASRVRTTAGADWTTGYSDAQWHNSPDFTSVISELISTYSYNAGIIQILVDDNGSLNGSETTGYTFESGYVPTLYIRYHTSFVITATAGTGGTISPSGNIPAISGENKAFTIAANSGYHIADVLVDGVSQGAIGTYTFTNVVANHTITANFTIDASGGDNGSSGSSGGGSSYSPPPGYTNLSSYVGSDGIVTVDATARSNDNKVVLTLSTGTKFLTTVGSRATVITITPRLNILAPPAGSGVIGLTYNFGPEGATFNPGATLTFSYAGLDLGTFNENNLALAFWDSQAGQWVKLSGYQVDTVNKTVTAIITHFSTYGILGYPPTPAAFTISNLVVAPTVVEAGKDVTVTISVTNTGELSGVYTAALMVGGTAEATKDITVNAGETQQVSFIVTRDQAGIHKLSIGAINASFTSLKPAAYTISDLVVSPASVEAGKDITVTFQIVNTGEVSGIYTATLEIGDVTEATRDIALAAGESQPVTFIVQRSQPGTYSVTVGNLSGSFTSLVPVVVTIIETITPTQTVTVSATAASLPVSQPISLWWWVGLILAVGFLVIVLIKTRRRNRVQ